jgi:hypothetical protein
MPYDTKNVKRDAGGVPVPQVFDSAVDDYVPAPGDTTYGMDVDVTRLSSILPGADPHAASTWSVAGVAADNALASAIRAAEAGKSHYITGVSAAYSAAVVGKLLEVKDGATVLHRTYVHSARDLEWPKPLKGTAGNAVSVELAASGSLGQLGVVSLTGYTI